MLAWGFPSGLSWVVALRRQAFRKDNKFAKCNCQHSAKKKTRRKNLCFNSINLTSLSKKRQQEMYKQNYHKSIQVSSKKKGKHHFLLFFLPPRSFLDFVQMINISIPCCFVLGDQDLPPQMRRLYTCVPWKQPVICDDLDINTHWRNLWLLANFLSPTLQKVCRPIDLH